MDFDVFVSYGWGKYTALSITLADALRALGHSVWLDREQVTEKLSDSELTAKIQQGLANSRYVAFFEAEARMAAQVGGDPVHVPRWQEKELQWADKQRLLVLYHSMKPPTMFAGQSSIKHPYETLQDAAKLIHEAIADPDKFFKPTSGGGASATVDTLSSTQFTYVSIPPPPKYMKAGGSA